MKIIGNLQINRRVTIENILNVYNLAKLAAISKMKNKKIYLKQIIEEIAAPIRGKRIKEKYFNLINDLFKEIGILNKKKEMKNYDFSKFESFIDYIAARINKTPYEVKKNCTAAELRRYAIEVSIRDLEKIQNLIFVYHSSPTEFSNSIKRSLTRLRNRVNLIQAREVKRIKEKGALKKEEKKEVKAGKVLRMRPAMGSFNIVRG
jgi:hypothetical protein